MANLAIFNVKTFDDVVYDILIEDQTPYQFDTKKVFYLLPASKGDFIELLKKYVDADTIPLPGGRIPAKKPMFQMGSLAGKMADSQLWASLILDYINSHGDPLKLKEILRNAQVKPSDIALYNLYNDIKNYLGSLLEYKLPAKKSHFDKDKFEDVIEPEDEEEEEGPSLGRKAIGIAGKLALGLLN